LDQNIDIKICDLYGKCEDPSMWHNAISEHCMSVCTVQYLEHTVNTLDRPHKQSDISLSNLCQSVLPTSASSASERKNLSSLPKPVSEIFAVENCKLVVGEVLM
jgi:hypothetical protein